MKVVLFCGGYGTRISEESAVRPKPMVEIGGKPMLWHILNIYAVHGFDDFVIACGYRGEGRLPRVATQHSTQLTPIVPGARVRYLAEIGEAAETIEDLGLDDTGTAETAAEVVGLVNDLRARLSSLKAARHDAHEADDEAVAMLETADALLVQEDGKPVGVVTRQDLLSYLAQSG